MAGVALILYGDGGELGSFKVFADHLARELSGKYSEVKVKYVNRDFAFFNEIKAIDPSKQLIEELHIFSHSIGAGIFLGYQDAALSMARSRAVQNALLTGGRVSYTKAVQTEVGAIQTDDFFMGPTVAQKAEVQSRFSPSATIKIWGCNSGVRGWVYSDGGITDPHDNSVTFYWRAFNERNTPKPSIAQAMASYFGRPVYGASSGASIEVKHNRKWISSKQYRNTVGQWPSGSLPHRLVPDNGTYREYRP